MKQGMDNEVTLEFSPTKLGLIARVVMNRPDRFNTMTAQFLDALLDCVEKAVGEKDCRVLILTGAGRAFCAGGALDGGLEVINGPRPVAAQAARLRRFMRISQLLHLGDAEGNGPVTIAAINGACAGAGLSLACACDFRFASDSARFNTAFLTVGVSGDFGASWLLTRLTGPSRARRLMLSPSRIDASEARAMGLVDDVVPASELTRHTDAFADQIASAAPLAVRNMRNNLIDAERMDFLSYLEVEAARHAQCCASADAAEAASAFLEKRPVQFRAR